MPRFLKPPDGGPPERTNRLWRKAEREHGGAPERIRRQWRKRMDGKVELIYRADLHPVTALREDGLALDFRRSLDDPDFVVGLADRVVADSVIGEHPAAATVKDLMALVFGRGRRPGDPDFVVRLAEHVVADAVAPPVAAARVKDLMALLFERSGGPDFVVHLWERVVGADLAALLAAATVKDGVGFTFRRTGPAAQFTVALSATADAALHQPEFEAPLIADGLGFTFREVREGADFRLTLTSIPRAVPVAPPRLPQLRMPTGFGLTRESR